MSKLRSMMFVAGVAFAAGACKSNETPRPSEAELAAATAKVGTVSVDQVATLLETGGCQPLDANGAPTRKREGVIPGAILLTNHRTYAMSELPADKSKKLVFYCANEECGASHSAAQRAVLAGYTDVSVLPAGIAGWKKAGKTADQI